MLSLSVFPLPIRFLSSASLPVPATQPLLLPFLLFPVPPRSCFPGARFRSRFLGFPVLSGPVSRALFPGSCTRLSVCFLSSLPVSLPQLFHRCLPLTFVFGLSPSCPFSFVHFHFRFLLLSFCFFRSLLPVFAFQWLFQCFVFCFRFLRFPRSLLPDFSCIPLRFWYLAFCLFPFILPGFAPTAVPPVLPFFHFLASVSFSGFFAYLRLSFVRLGPLLTTQLSALSFPFFLISPGSGSFSACFPLSILVLSLLQFLSPFRCFVSQ